MSLSISSGDHGRLRVMQQLTTRQERTSARLASQKRIGSAADDAAGLAIARRLEATARGMAQGERNVADGQSLVRTADASLQQSQDTLARMRELTIQAGNGTLSASDRGAIQAEYDQLSAQLDQTAGGTSFGGRTLLDGSAGGEGATTITDGGGGDTVVDLPDVGATALGVAGQSVADPATVATLDAAAERLGQLRSRLGATDNSFARQQEQLAAARVGAESARSRIEDADPAVELTQLIRDRILMSLQVAGHRRAGETTRHAIDRMG